MNQRPTREQVEISRRMALFSIAAAGAWTGLAGHVAFSQDKGERQDLHQHITPEIIDQAAADLDIPPEDAAILVDQAVSNAEKTTKWSFMAAAGIAVGVAEVFYRKFKQTVDTYMNGPHL